MEFRCEQDYCQGFAGAKQMLFRLCFLILRFGWFGLCERRLIIFIEGVEEELIGSVGLCAPLWLESEEEDAAGAVGDFEGGNLVFNGFGMQQEAAFERIAVFWIAREDCAVETGLGGEGWTHFEHDGGLTGQAPCDGAIGGG